MLALKLRVEDLASLRFACSPLQETVISLWTWQFPVRYAIHQPLVRSSSHLLKMLDWPLLQALVGPGGFIADFLTPPPRSPRPEFKEELETVRATDHALVLTGLLGASGGRPLHPRLRGVHADPEALVAEICSALGSYWELVLEPHWPRLSAILENDIMYRAKQMVASGAAGLFRDIDPRLVWTPGELLIDEPDVETAVEVDGRGLTFTPSLFCNRALTLVDLSLPPRICYPARGRATAWNPEFAESRKALSDLLGLTRAMILEALVEPASTTELSVRLGLSVGTVSQHLGVLYRAGLADRSRVGHSVIYTRTRMGDRLTQ